MHESTGMWLQPLVEGATTAGLDLTTAFRAARTPLPPGHPLGHLAADAGGPDAGLVGIDWVKCGRVLRHQLGWVDYPDSPGTAALGN